MGSHKDHLRIIPLDSNGNFILYFEDFSLSSRILILIHPIRILSDWLQILTQIPIVALFIMEFLTNLQNNPNNINFNSTHF